MPGTQLKTWSARQSRVQSKLRRLPVRRWPTTCDLCCICFLLELLKQPHCSYADAV